MRAGLFRGVHPTIVLTYGLISLVLAMCAVQPVCCVVAYVFVTLFGLAVEGASGLGRRILMQLATLLAIVAFNCVFSRHGANVLVSAGPVSVTLESIVFGMCMGLMLLNAVHIFALLGRLVSTDDALSLFNGRLPVVSLMVSMTLGLVPQLGMQARDMGDVAKACTALGGAAAPSGPSPEGAHRRRKGAKEGASFYARMIATLSSNALEDSIVRADSMRARGWGSGTRRTSYRRRMFKASDGVRLAGVVALGALASWGALSCMASSSFYPAVAICPDVAPYVAFALFFAMPCVLVAAKGSSWKA